MFYVSCVTECVCVYEFVLLKSNKKMKKKIKKN